MFKNKKTFRRAGKACRVWGGSLVDVPANWTQLTMRLEQLLINASLPATWVGAVIERAKVYTYSGQGTSVTMSGRARGCAQFFQATKGLRSVSCFRKLPYVCQRVNSEAGPAVNRSVYSVLWNTGQVRHRQAARACMQAGLAQAAPTTPEELEEASTVVGQSHVTVWLAGKYSANSTWLNASGSELEYPDLHGRAKSCVQLVPTRTPGSGFGGKLVSNRCAHRR